MNSSATNSAESGSSLAARVLEMDRDIAFLGTYREAMFTSSWTSVGEPQSYSEGAHSIFIPIAPR